MKASLLEKGSLRSNEYIEQSKYKLPKNSDLKDVIISEEEIL